MNLFSFLKISDGKEDVTTMSSAFREIEKNYPIGGISSTIKILIIVLTLGAIVILVKIFLIICITKH
jgi:amino acid transporter